MTPRVRFVAHRKISYWDIGIFTVGLRTPANNACGTRPFLRFCHDFSTATGVPRSEDFGFRHGREVGRRVQANLHTGGIHPGGRLVGRRGEQKPKSERKQPKRACYAACRLTVSCGGIEG